MDTRFKGANMAQTNSNTPIRGVLAAAGLILSAGPMSGCITQSSESSRVTVPGPAPLQAEVPRGGVIELALANGAATVTSAPIDHVEVGVEVRCSKRSARCRERASRARLVTSMRDGRVRFGLKNAPGKGASLSFRVRVPDDRALDVRMKYGDLQIAHHNQDINVQMTAGAIGIELPESAVGRVDLNARVGEAALSTDRGEREGRRPLLVGSRVQWAEGRGPHAVQARVRFGDIQLRLTR